VKKYLRERLREILKLDDPPQKLALAFAIGVFIAFSPWLGLHIVSAFAFAWMFRLNKVVILTGSFINNPWTIVPMYAFCLWFGIRITGGMAEVPEIAWSTLGFRDLFSVLLPFLWPFVAGTVVLGAIASALSYGMILWLIRRYRQEEAGLRGGSSSGHQER
jgi:uncharacterized protein (DUF2062 family)